MEMFQSLRGKKKRISKLVSNATNRDRDEFEKSKIPRVSAVGKRDVKHHACRVNRFVVVRASRAHEFQEWYYEIG